MKHVELNMKNDLQRKFAEKKCMNIVNFAETGMQQ